MAKVKKLKEITIDVAAEAIRARKNDNSKTLVIPIEKIQEAVGAFYGVSVKEIKGSRRVQNIVLARQVGHVSFKRDDGQLSSLESEKNSVGKTIRLSFMPMKKLKVWSTQMIIYDPKFKVSRKS